MVGSTAPVLIGVLLLPVLLISSASAAGARANPGTAANTAANTAAAVESAVALPSPYRHSLSVTQDAREIANPQPLTLSVASRSVRLVLPDPTLQFAGAHFRAFGANFEHVGTVPLDPAGHSVTVALPSDFFAVSASHLPLDGFIATDAADYYGIELIGTGVTGAGPPPGASVPTGPPSTKFEAFLTFRATAPSPVTAPSYDLRWDPEQPWTLFDGRSSTHGEATWIPSPQTVWAGDRVTIRATEGYFVRGLSGRYLIEASIIVMRAEGPPGALPVPFSVSANGSALALTVPDAVHSVPLSELVPRINVTLTNGPETHDTILIYLPLVFRPGGDTNPPTVIDLTPVTHATAVERGTSVAVTFSEPVRGISSATFTLRSAAGTVPARVDYAAATRVARLNPLRALSPDRRYTARLSGIRDLAGNILATQSWIFITGPAPTVRAVLPAAGSSNVPRGRSVVASLSEPVLGVSTGTVKLVVAATGASVPVTISYLPASRTITVDPTAALAPNTRYRATITGGARAVRDLAGNPLVTRSLTFKTAAAL